VGPHRVLAGQPESRRLRDLHRLRRADRRVGGRQTQQL